MTYDAREECVASGPCLSRVDQEHVPLARAQDGFPDCDYPPLYYPPGSPQN